MKQQLVFTLSLILSIGFTTSKLRADLVAFVDLTPGAEAITITGSDTGELIFDGVKDGNNSWYLLEWRRDLLPPEVAGGSQGDAVEVVLEQVHQSSTAYPGFDLRALDKIEQFTLNETDNVVFGRRTLFAGSAATVEVTLNGTGVPVDISNWNDVTLNNLREASLGSGVLPVAVGNGWSPIRFQTSTVPEPTTFASLLVLSTFGMLRRRRRLRNKQA